MIRDAIESDLPFLAAAMVRLQDAHVAANPEIYRPFETSDAMTYFFGLFSQSDASVRVALHEDAIVGHAVFMIETRPESLFTHSQRYGHIAQIEVEPESRRKGYGRLLLADCERIAASHDLQRIVLSVWAFNNAGRSFYQSFGYGDLSFRMSRSI